MQLNIFHAIASQRRGTKQTVQVMKAEMYVNNAFS